MLSSKLLPLLAVIDTILLAVIVIAVVTSGERVQKTVVMANESVQEVISPSVPAMERNRIDLKEPIEQSVSDYAPETEVWKESEVPIETSPKTTQAGIEKDTIDDKKTENDRASSQIPFDISPFDTNEKARLQDFNWGDP